MCCCFSVLHPHEMQVLCTLNGTDKDRKTFMAIRLCFTMEICLLTYVAPSVCNATLPLLNSPVTRTWYSAYKSHTVTSPVRAAGTGISLDID